SGAAPARREPDAAAASSAEWRGDMAGYPMPGMASSEQMEELRNADGLEADRLFLELMITHHSGGIHMVDGVLALTEHEDVIWLSEIMKEGQQLERVVLRDILEEVKEQAGVD